MCGEHTVTPASISVFSSNLPKYIPNYTPPYEQPIATIFLKAYLFFKYYNVWCKSATKSIRILLPSITSSSK